MTLDSTKNRCVIFYTPENLSDKTAMTSGSDVRPRRLHEAFFTLGRSVEVIDGSSSQRKHKARLLKQKMISTGLKVDFVYFELATPPICFTDKDKIPRNLFSDFLFLRWLKKQGVPVGVFYRDVHWRFPSFKKNLALWKRCLLYVGYWLEAEMVRRVSRVVFVPTLKLVPELPSQLRRQFTPVAVPPGSMQVLQNVYAAPQNPLRLLYIGGILPPTYDFSKQMKVVSEISNVRFTFCCREWEWQQAQELYPKSKNIEVVHKSGEEVKKLYSEADLFVCIWGDDPYAKLGLPVKIFECLSFGVPIITRRGIECGDVVESLRIGWTVNSVEDLKDLLAHLAANPNEILEKRRWLEKIKGDHTWEKRAQQIAAALVSP